MRITINATQLDGLDVTDAELRLLLGDALLALIDTYRPTTEAYVDKYYPAGYGYFDREKQVASINKRKLIANRLHRSVLKLKTSR